MSFKLTKERAAQLPEIFARYPQKRAAMLPVLWLVHEQEGWIPPAAMEFVGETLDVKVGAVMEVVSFYTMFNREPIGKYHIQVCNNVCCRLRDADWLVDYLKEKLEIEVGDNTSDGKFKLSTVECLASCGTAPMMQINDDYYENLNADKVDKIIEELRNQ